MSTPLAYDLATAATPAALPPAIRRMLARQRRRRPAARRMAGLEYDLVGGLPCFWRDRRVWDTWRWAAPARAASGPLERRP